MDETVQFLEKEREVTNRLVCLEISMLRKSLRELKDVSEVLCSAKGESDCEKRFIHLNLSIAMVNEMEKWLC